MNSKLILNSEFSFGMEAIRKIEVENFPAFICAVHGQRIPGIHIRLSGISHSTIRIRAAKIPDLRRFL